MIIGAGTYNLPSGCVAIYSIRDTTLKRKIKRASFRKFDNIDVAASGDPTHYIRYGTTFELTPVPSAANGLLIRYGKVIVDMSADIDVPTITEPWHEAILLGAEVRGWRALRQLDQMTLVKNEYISMIRSRQPEWEQEEEDEEWGMEVAS